MPMIKDAAPPLSAERVRELRGALSADYGRELVRDGGAPVLVIRVPSARPDFLLDVDRAAEFVTEEEVRAAKDILLVGNEKIIRVDPIPLRDKIRERSREDSPLADGMRSSLQRVYGLDVVRPQGARGPAILGVRIPRERATEMQAEDRATLSPLIEDALKGTRDVAKVFLVADRDFRKLSPGDLRRVLRGESLSRIEASNTMVAGSNPQPGRSGGFGQSPFAGLIGEAMETDQVIKAKKLARGGQTAPVPPPAASAPASSPRPSAPVGPFGGLVADATVPLPSRLSAPEPPPKPALPPTSPVPPVPSNPLEALARRFQEAGYELAPMARDAGFDLAAHKEGGKKLLAKKVATLDLATGESLVAQADALEADAVVVVTDTAAPGTRAYALGTKLEIVRTGDVAGLEL